MPSTIPPPTDISALAGVYYGDSTVPVHRRMRATRCIFFDERANNCLSRFQFDSPVQEGYDIPNSMYDLLSVNRTVIGKV